MDDYEQSLLHLLASSLREDVGDSDITSAAIIPDELKLRGCVFAKEEGIIAGLEVLQKFFSHFYPQVFLIFHRKDGERVSKGQRIVDVQGPGRILLATERLVLNIMQRMSGIATQTEHYVDCVRGTKAIILDTRKTVPGLRILDKQAVRLGGGTNHRLGLFDSYLIKENHIEAAGSIREAVRRVQEHNTKGRMVEVEVRTLPDLKEAVRLKVDRILLDNMSVEQMRSAVTLVAGKIPLEASGNVTLETVRQVAETGVDFISVGSLTHSVRALDLSFIIEKSKTE